MDGEPRTDENPSPTDRRGDAPTVPPSDGSTAADAPVEAGDDAAPEDEASSSTRGSDSRRGWSRPVAAVATAAVTVALGFALTTQIRTTAEPQDEVVGREEDLVVILDEINQREETLRQQIGETRQTVEDLSSGRQESGAALEEARSRAQAIGILAGTLPASGPGLRLTVRDPDGAVPASVVLGAIQELRGAGAEAMEVDGVRIVVSSAVTGTPGDLRIDGEPLSAPYEFRAVGPPAAMEVALNVSGGVVADIGRVGGEARVEQVDSLVVDAVVD
ncbi:DUF881 domain-containing protein [Blastococcus capsensis]|uniref:DUF881 domain-containing protein n=1 Tax=Blastococcus capsensis TaxID=1564163 RepID=UPI002540F84B|nr:DUF881 domain-containing protein [Blastococcus capsensis]MDK3256356.1 DUF881 domain-containing protein [Blastococcus capsensis]